MMYSLEMPLTISVVVGVVLCGLEVMTDNTRVIPASFKASSSRARRLGC